MPELMITAGVAIALAGMAVSQMAPHHDAARVKEAAVVVDGLMIAQVTYEGTYDTYLDCAVQPRSTASLDKRQVSWPASSGNFELLGFAPDGAVRGAYYCETNPSSGVFVVCVGVIDPDADGVGEVFARALTDAQASYQPRWTDWFIRPVFAANTHTAQNVHLIDYKVTGSSPSSITSAVVSELGVGGGEKAEKEEKKTKGGGGGCSTAEAPTRAGLGLLALVMVCVGRRSRRARD